MRKHCVPVSLVNRFSAKFIDDIRKWFQKKRGFLESIVEGQRWTCLFTDDFHGCVYGCVDTNFSIFFWMLRQVLYKKIIFLKMKVEKKNLRQRKKTQTRTECCLNKLGLSGFLYFCKGWVYLAIPPIITNIVFFSLLSPPFFSSHLRKVIISFVKTNSFVWKSNTSIYLFLIADLICALSCPCRDRLISRGTANSIERKWTCVCDRQLNDRTDI